MRSDQIKKGPDRAPARAMLRATGLDDRQIDQPLIAVVNTWSDANPCHAHLRTRAEDVKRGVWQAGGFPLEMPALSLGESALSMPFTPDHTSPRV